MEIEEDRDVQAASLPKSSALPLSRGRRSSGASFIPPRVAWVPPVDLLWLRRAKRRQLPVHLTWLTGQRIWPQVELGRAALVLPAAPRPAACSRC